MTTIPQKIRILKFIAEQGVVTVDDISRVLFENDAKSTAIRIAMHKLKIGHAKFGNIKHGVWYIDKPELFDLLKTYFPDIPAFEVKPLLLYQVPHNLEINRIRIALEKTPNIAIDQWWSERFIRALPSPIGGRIAITNIPDAIFWRRRTDGTRQKFFLEYERTLKNKNRYEEIFCSYARREDVSHKNVIYICENDFIRQELEQVEAKLAKAGKLSGAGLYFQFVTLDNFYKTYSNNPTNKEKKQ
jgi:hypothetical protein